MKIIYFENNATTQVAPEVYLTPTVDQLQSCLETTKKEAHPNCVGCGSAGSFGLGLNFLVREDGGVEAEFPCRQVIKATRTYCTAA